MIAFLIKCQVAAFIVKQGKILTKWFFFLIATHMREEKPAEWHYSAGCTGNKVCEEIVGGFLRGKWSQPCQQFERDWEKRIFIRRFVQRWLNPLQATELESSYWLRAAGPGPDKVLQDASMVQDWEKPCLAWISFHYIPVIGGFALLWNWQNCKWQSQCLCRHCLEEEGLCHNLEQPWGCFDSLVAEDIRYQKILL